MDPTASYRTPRRPTLLDLHRSTLPLPPAALRVDPEDVRGGGLPTTRRRVNRLRRRPAQRSRERYEIKKSGLRYAPHPALHRTRMPPRVTAQPAQLGHRRRPSTSRRPARASWWPTTTLRLHAHATRDRAPPFAPSPPTSSAEVVRPARARRRPTICAAYPPAYRPTSPFSTSRWRSKA